MATLTGKRHAPGSDDALEAGCRCPILENGHGRGYMGMEGFYVYTEDCEYHKEDWKALIKEEEDE